MRVEILCVQVTDPRILKEDFVLLKPGADFFVEARRTVDDKIQSTWRDRGTFEAVVTGLVDLARCAHDEEHDRFIIKKSLHYLSMVDVKSTMKMFVFDCNEVLCRLHLD